MLLNRSPETAVSSPYVVATMVQLDGEKPNWATYPVDGVHVSREDQTVYIANVDAAGTVIPFCVEDTNALVVGNPRHDGLYVPAGARGPTHRKRTPQFNLQAISLILESGVDRIVDTFSLSRDDAAAILEERLPQSDATERALVTCQEDPRLATALVIGHCLGVNLVLGGVDHLTIGNEIGPYSLEGIEEAVPKRDGSIFITGINRPCRMPAGLLARVYELDQPDEVVQQFKEEIWNDRGYVAQITENGTLVPGVPLLDAPYRA
jgi:hypothetical protein